MNVDLSALTISATKPKGKLAAMLADMGIGIVPILLRIWPTDVRMASKDRSLADFTTRTCNQQASTHAQNRV